LKTSLGAITVFAACVLCSCAKEAERQVTIAMLEGNPAYLEAGEGFKARLAALGYPEGGRCSLVRFSAMGKSAEEAAALQAIEALKPDLIFAYPTGSAVAAKPVAERLGAPLVFAVTVLKGSGLIEGSLMAPGGLVTGVQVPGPDGAVKRLELLMEIAPGIKRALVAYEPGYGSKDAAMALLREASGVNGIALIERTIASVEGLKVAIAGLPGKGSAAAPDCVVLLPDAITMGEGWPLLEGYAEAAGIPVAGLTEANVEEGAVLAYLADLYETGALAADAAARILAGAPPGGIPVGTSPGKLVVNEKAAARLGLSIPPSVRALAKRIVRDD
jgi:putative ABC transport system substrate-binding protein